MQYSTHLNKCQYVAIQHLSAYKKEARSGASFHCLRFMTGILIQVQPAARSRTFRPVHRHRSHVRVPVSEASVRPEEAYSQPRS